MPPYVPAAAALLALLPVAAASPPREPQVLEKVEVSRVVLEARVVDGSGRPIPNLGPTDFRLQVDGRTARLESAIWVQQGAASASSPGVGSGSNAADRASATEPRPALGAGPGRLLVLLFQKDLESSRLSGLVRATEEADVLLQELEPRDRVAVLVFDSHLRLHVDFTADRAELRRAITGSVLLRWPDPPTAGPEPSLAAHLDPDEASRAASPEEALLALGRALQPIPGAKSLLLFGWGLGQLSGGLFETGPHYEAARAALEHARTSVFCLDVTDADWHSLEVGLKAVATDTGGAYLKMSEHAALALRLVARLIAGHYVLTFERPDGPRGPHRVRLSLARGHGTILTRAGYVD
jgi:VWFA-related protein